MKLVQEIEEYNQLRKLINAKELMMYSEGIHVPIDSNIEDRLEGSSEVRKQNLICTNHLKIDRLVGSERNEFEFYLFSF